MRSNFQNTWIQENKQLFLDAHAKPDQENKSKKGCIVKLRNIQRESDLNNL